MNKKETMKRFMNWGETRMYIHDKFVRVSLPFRIGNVFFCKRVSQVQYLRPPSNETTY